MISAVILFSVLAYGTIAYRVSLNTAERIHARIYIMDAIPAILLDIKTKIMKGNMQGIGQVGKNITWKWQATKIGSSQNVLNALAETGSGIILGKFRVVLATVQLEVEFRSGSFKKVLRYEYRELAWFNATQ